MTIPSSKDPTLAPEGHHVVLLFTMYTPYHLSNGRVWDDTTRNQYADCGENILYAVNMPIFSVNSSLYRRKKDCCLELFFSMNQIEFTLSIFQIKARSCPRSLTSDTHT